MGEKIKLVVSSLCICQWIVALFGMACSSTTPMVRDLDRSPEIMVLSRPVTALSDFNASLVNNRLLLHPGDSEEDLAAAAAAAVALSLESVRITEYFLTALNLKNLEVQASTRPRAPEDDDAPGTGEKAQVTVISFTTSRWRRNFHQHNPTIDNPQLNVFGLHGYDIAGALAMAGDAVEAANFCDQKANNPQNLSLVSGQLQSSTFETVNIECKRRGDKGLWEPQNRGKASNSSSWDDLGSIVWPGDSTPIGVPVIYEFSEFVTVKRKGVSGYGINKFMVHLEEMSSANVSECTYCRKPIKEMAATYNGLVYQVYTKNFHTFVGDTSVINCMLPFRKSDSTQDGCRRYEGNHWLVNIYFFVFIGSVVWILVKLVNNDFESQTHHARTSL